MRGLVVCEWCVGVVVCRTDTQARPSKHPLPAFLPPFHCSVCLDCTVTVVDGRHVQRQLADSRPAGAINEAQQQVALADVVLLNKLRKWWRQAIDSCRAAPNVCM
jgi:G3E family GTPase